MLLFQNLYLEINVLKIRGFLILFSVIFLFCSFKPESEQIVLFNSEAGIAVKNISDSVTLVFAGDIMGHSPQYQAAYNPATKTYSYQACFKEVKPYIEKADFAIANLEVPIAGRPYSGYPNFSSPDALLDGLKYAGYDILLTANNHVLDRGKLGLERTINKIKDLNLKFSGSYINENQRDSLYPLIIESKGLKIALFNYTYGTNAGVVTAPNIVNYIDTVQILKDIQKVDIQGVDFKIMNIHWGVEYELEANNSQKNLAQFFVDHGINVIIGSHPHVVQNAELLYNKDSVAVPVYYSLGNSISNQRKIHTNGGLMVKVVLDTNTKSVRNTSYLPVYVHKGVLNAVYQYHLIPTDLYISNPGKYKIPPVDNDVLKQFDTETRNRLSNVAGFVYN